MQAGRGREHGKQNRRGWGDSELIAPCCRSHQGTDARMAPRGCTETARAGRIEGIKGVGKGGRAGTMAGAEWQPVLTSVADETT